MLDQVFKKVEETRTVHTQTISALLKDEDMDLDNFLNHGVLP